jgi:alpha-ketoglutarate-dependent taurine dioxygenase
MRLLWKYGKGCRLRVDRFCDAVIEKDDARQLISGFVVRRVVDELHALLRGELRTGRGFVIVRGPEGLDLGEAKEFTLAVSALLGTVMPQDFAGERIREVRDRGTDIIASRSARYSDTRFGGHLHTDGMHRPGHIPDVFALYCYRPALVGGESVSVHIDEILDRLRTPSAMVRTLSGEFHFDTRDPDPIRPRTVPRPVIEETEQGLSINYLREYIDSGHRSPGVPPLTPDQKKALDRMDEILADGTLHRFTRLDAGELMIINNRRIVHGRTDFMDDPGSSARRLLLRTWIDTRCRDVCR